MNAHNSASRKRAEPVPRQTLPRSAQRSDLSLSSGTVQVLPACFPKTRSCLSAEFLQRDNLPDPLCTVLLKTVQRGFFFEKPLLSMQCVASRGDRAPHAGFFKKHSKITGKLCWRSPFRFRRVPSGFLWLCLAACFLIWGSRSWRLGVWGRCRGLGRRWKGEEEEDKKA